MEKPHFIKTSSTEEPRPKSCNFIKKEALAQVFSCKFCEISKNTFFTEQLWMTASLVKQTLDYLTIWNLKLDYMIQPNQWNF